jgi:hypothetical protein
LYRVRVKVKEGLVIMMAALSFFAYNAFLATPL